MSFGRRWSPRKQTLASWTGEFEEDLELEWKQRLRILPKSMWGGGDRAISFMLIRPRVHKFCGSAQLFNSFLPLKAFLSPLMCFSALFWGRGVKSEPRWSFSSSFQPAPTPASQTARSAAPLQRPRLRSSRWALLSLDCVKMRRGNSNKQVYFNPCPPHPNPHVTIPDERFRSWRPSSELRWALELLLLWSCCLSPQTEITCLLCSSGSW